MAKLKFIMIDKLNFDQNLREVLVYLTKKSKELDPDHVGVNFVLSGDYQPPPSGPHREVSLSLTDVPLLDVILYVCEQADCACKIEGGRVVVFPLKK